ncbi:MAG: hypothetical protein CML42_08170 [Rhodobacteraceae bacterium]|nr:hypothetical protein [Paracoccaceae bacterium]|tara:strand:- start:73581 stop:74135 length:555 start_codon:yes stop_codon:yes gene_type:complete
MSETTNNRAEEIIKLVKRQTNYDDETIEKKMIEHNNNYINVIKEYIVGSVKTEKKKEDIKKSVNQQIFGEIRGFMDDVNKKFEHRKVLAKRQLYYQQAALAAMNQKQKEENTILNRKNDSIQQKKNEPTPFEKPKFENVMPQKLPDGTLSMEDISNNNIPQIYKEKKDVVSMIQHPPNRFSKSL